MCFICNVMIGNNVDEKKYCSCEIKGYCMLINKIILINVMIYVFFLKEY